MENQQEPVKGRNPTGCIIGCAVAAVVAVLLAFVALMFLIYVQGQLTAF